MLNQKYIALKNNFKGLIWSVLLCSSLSLSAQPKLNIALISDNPQASLQEFDYLKQVEEEILILLQQRFDVQFNLYAIEEGKTYSSAFSDAYNANDIIVALGTGASGYALAQNSFPKPTVASIVLDNKLQGVNRTSEGTSGIQNFTYMESPFDIQRDLDLLYQIEPFTKLFVIAEEDRVGQKAFVKQLFETYLDEEKVEIEVLHLNEPLAERLPENLEQTNAAYVLPYFGADTAAIPRLFEILNAKKIPSAAMLGDEYLKDGALVGYQAEANLNKIPRRIALMVMKIAEGQDPGNLSVAMENFGENLLINMATAKQIGIYPVFDLMNQATLINHIQSPDANQWTINKAIGYALQNNLDIRVGQSDVGLAQTEIGIAKANLLPQVDVSTNLSYTDQLTAFSYQGALGRANWIAAGELSQVVLSEPALANVTIQKLLTKSADKALLQTQLDVIIDVASAYTNILFAQSNLDIQQQNVERNKENYDIAKAKEAIGFSGTSDLNRWEAEVANANIALNDAYANLRKSRFQLNQLLNLEIDTPLELTDMTLEGSMILITDDRTEFIDDYGKINKFADFMVKYALANLPELAQLDYNIDAQKRLQLSRERALYLPTVGLSGSVNRTLGRANVPEGLPSIDKATTWTLGLGISYPVFQGNNRRKLIDQSKLNVIQLQDTRRNAENQFELRVRSNLENVAASFSEMRLSKIAAEASQKNFEIIQDAYSAGSTNVVTLIDAQNNALASQLSATNAVFGFILDFLILERSIGYFNFLATEKERTSFFQQVQNHFSN